MGNLLQSNWTWTGKLSTTFKLLHSPHQHTVFFHLAVSYCLYGCPLQFVSLFADSGDILPFSDVIILMFAAAVRRRGETILQNVSHFSLH